LSAAELAKKVVEAEAPKEEAPTQDLSAQFAALSKKEKKLFEDQARIKELEKKYGPIEKALSAAKEKPTALLEAAGITLDDLIQYQLKNGQPPTAEDKVATIEAKLKAYEEQIKSKEEAAEQARIDRAIADFKGQIKAHVATDAAKFELVAANNAFDTVYEVCEQYYNETGKQLDISKAAELVEAELFENAKKVLNLSKMKALYATAEAPKVLDTQKATGQSSQTTLTNKSAASTQVAPPKPLSREESLKRAAEALRWT
jgi:hypothetical protein